MREREAALRRKSKYLLPNMITASSLVMGLVSIYFSHRGEFDLAAWVILYSAILDKLDGTTARALKASSPFGTEFDSFSDFTAFGLAPAFLVFSLCHTDPALNAALHVGDSPFFVFFSVVFFVLASATRLARFNITSVPGSRFILGMATTVAGGLVASFVLTCRAHADIPIFQTALTSLPYVLVIFAVLMLSTIPSLKVGGRRKRLSNLIDALILATIGIFIIARIFPEVVFLTGFVAVIYGFVVGIKNRAEAFGRDCVDVVGDEAPCEDDEEHD